MKTYAIRRCNPFLGVLQVLEYGSDRAVSSNGLSWEIELRAERSVGWGSLNSDNCQTAWYRYGCWTAQDGLVERPLAPQFDRRIFRRRCETLIGVISEQLQQLPFRLMDKFEYWLFDGDDRRPLALLASVLPGHTLPSPEPRKWAASLGPRGVPGQRRFPDADTLEAWVRQYAGANGFRHWVQRQTDGSGLVAETQNRLPAQAFPAFLLAEDWPDTRLTCMAREYMAWTAPALLTLQHLSRPERSRLEKSLNVQAESVEHHWRLYPEILDNDRVRTARVQCHLQRAHKSGGEMR